METPSSGDEPTVFDAVLVSARAGESWAFDDLFDRVARRVHGFLRARGAPDPEGLANEALLRAFRNIDTFEGNETQFRAWLFTIARNLLVDERRKQHRRPDAVPTEPARLPEQDVAGAGEVAMEQMVNPRLLRHLDALSDDQREVLLLRVVADLSTEQTAGVVGKSEGAVKGLLHRAIRTLRERMGDDADERA